MVETPSYQAVSLNRKYLTYFMPESGFLPGWKLLYVQSF